MREGSSNMLKRDFLKNIAENKIDDEIMEYAQEYLNKIIKKDNDRKGEIVDFLVDMDASLMTAKEVGKAVGISTSRASRYLDQLVEEEIIESFDGKRRKKYAK